MPTARQLITWPPVDFAFTWNEDGIPRPSQHLESVSGSVNGSAPVLGLTHGKPSVRSLSE